MLSVQLKDKFTFCLLLIACLQLITSCSIQQKISKSAKQVINDSSLLTAHTGISIYEPASGKYWYNYHGDKYFVPASNTKIPTCYAAMKYLGDSLVGLKYEIKEGPSSFIQGTGDPTFLHPDFKTQPVFDFIKKLQNIVYTDILTFNPIGNGWSWNDYREAYMAQRSPFPIYGNVAEFKWMGNNEIEVSPKFFQKDIKIAYNNNLEKGFDLYKPWDKNEFIFFEGNVKNKDVPFNPDFVTIDELLEDTLGLQIVHAPFSTVKPSQKIYSQPTDSLLKPMMHRSDNFFAEQSLLMVSNERLGAMNDAKIIDTILKTDFKDLPQRPRWADGSGLSRYNLFTPQDFVAILNKMKNEFGMERIKVIFPTGGEGTISNYYKPDSNYIFAKTGTLSGVVAFSGFLYTKKGKLLIFSTLVNNHQASSTAVRRAVEKFLQGIREKY